MDVTECMGFPYPQCDPPLTKGASDIEQLRDFAFAVDDAVQDFADDITNNLVRPPACRMSNGVPVVSTLGDNTIPMDAFTFDNQPGNAMADLVNGVIRIPEDGWYLIGSWMQATVVANISLRTRFIVNGDPATNFQGSAGIAQAGVAQNLTAKDMLFLRAGDGFTVQARSGLPGTSVSYSAIIWTVQVAPNV